jgi:hypothetical protein
MPKIEIIALMVVFFGSICNAAAFGLKMLAREVGAKLLLPSSALHPQWLEFNWIVFPLKWIAILYLSWMWGWAWLLIFIAFVLFLTLVSQFFNRIYAIFIHRRIDEIVPKNPNLAELFRHQMNVQDLPDRRI